MASLWRLRIGRTWRSVRAHRLVLCEERLLGPRLELKVKDFTIEISELSESDKQRLGSEPSFATLDLDEKVRLLADEVIKFLPWNLQSVVLCDRRGQRAMGLANNQ